MAIGELAKPVGTCLASTETVKTTVASLESNGCKVTEGSYREGYMTVSEGDKPVYKVLQKGHRQPWIVIMYNGDRVRWQKATPV